MNRKSNIAKSTPEDAELFFSAIGYRDRKTLQNRVSRFALVTVIMSFFVAIVSLLTTLIVISKPTPVIAFDQQGKRMVFTGQETLSSETNRVRIVRFLKDFINNFDGVSPRVDEDLAQAYNALTPRFRQIVLDKGIHKGKIHRWKNKNIASDFTLLAYHTDGTFTVGSTLTVEGTGKFTLAPVIRTDGTASVSETEYLYFTALLIVTPVSLDISPDGLLVDFWSAKSFDDFRKLRAFLLQERKESLITDETKQPAGEEE